MEQEGFNHQAWHWMNINVMPFTFHHGELRFSHNVFVFSEWTQRIRFLVNFIALHWTTLLVRLQLHSSSTSKRFCDCMFFSCWRCARMTHNDNSTFRLRITTLWKAFMKNQKLSCFKIVSFIFFNIMKNHVH
jgi:hypothetical protein